MKDYWYQVYSTKMDIPDFELNDEDKFYLNLSLDVNHDSSKPAPGEHEWRLKRFGWSPFGSKENG